jgi:hypothetical protein
METDLGWSRAETTGAFSPALVLFGLAAIRAGRGSTATAHAR